MLPSLWQICVTAVTQTLASSHLMVRLTDSPLLCLALSPNEPQKSTCLSTEGSDSSPVVRPIVCYFKFSAAIIVQLIKLLLIRATMMKS